MKRFLFYILLLAVAAPAHAGTVVVSIKPLHSLAAAVMEGSGDAPLLLVAGQASPHTFSLKPSQVQALQRAGILFYIGDDFELFLRKVAASLPEPVRRAPMDKAAGITLYPLRAGEGFAPHDHHDHEEENGKDMHLWLMPANAKAMAAEIARRLSEAYPEHKPLYQANAEKLVAKLDALDLDLKKRLAPLRGKTFIVFHDAYQYFEKSYGLTAAGAITLHPEQGVRPKRLAALREKIRAAGAACVFREPSFDGRVVDNLLEGTPARSGVLDPEGALLEPGSELYFQLMENIAAGLEACLL